MNQPRIELKEESSEKVVAYLNLSQQSAAFRCDGFANKCHWDAAELHECHSGNSEKERRRILALADVWVAVWFNILCTECALIVTGHHGMTSC
ncbi:hypothetical protein V6N13_062499 [Hibiscus sabdariffa]|uniref:Uncharacterized protein n=2 Tax=Hibiscus sabdariffa TaxID=183260 RepID=A0ABR2AMB9_9ROSI